MRAETWAALSEIVWCNEWCLWYYGRAAARTIARTGQTRRRTTARTTVRSTVRTAARTRRTGRLSSWSLNIAPSRLPARPGEEHVGLWCRLFSSLSNRRHDSHLNVWCAEIWLRTALKAALNSDQVQNCQTLDKLRQRQSHCQVMGQRKAARVALADKGTFKGAATAATRQISDGVAGKAILRCEEGWWIHIFFPCKEARWAGRCTTERDALQEQARIKTWINYSLGLTKLCSALANSTDCLLEVYTPVQNFEHKFTDDWTNFRIGLLRRQKPWNSSVNKNPEIPEKIRVNFVNL